MITSRLRQRLQELSGDRYARLQVIETKAHQLLEFSQAGAHLAFTPHGVSHVSAVERNYDWLLDEADVATFNASECFCLIVATFFHDALMVPHRLGDEQAARANHVDRARTFLLQQRDLIGLSVHEVDIIAEVVKGHAVYDLTEIAEQVVLGSEIVALRKLGACLSLSDLCHADSTRAPEVVFRHLDFDQESRFHWRRHMQISGITRKDAEIIMSALVFSDEGRAAVEAYRTEIVNQLGLIRPFFDTILTPIRRVELLTRQLESPLEQTLQFQANTPAILRVLIEGVYDREDVFIRELVQNSLDACLLRRAKELRRGMGHAPMIVLTALMEKGHVRALRIDDNGVGMDISDVQDTVLWIGSSIAGQTATQTLLQETLRKNLIATFGIGLLTCFKASNSILVRTAKENGTPVQFALTGVSDNVKPEKSTDSTLGTTIVVTLNEDSRQQIAFEQAVKHYFRMVTQVDLKLMTLDWSPTFLSMSRSELFLVSSTEASPVEPVAYQDKDTIGTPVSGDDYTGHFWLPSAKVEEVIGYDGAVDILNEGVFVASALTTQWLPPHLRFCDGVINFAARAITLPAGRDRVIQNDVYRKKQQEIAEKSLSIIDRLVQETQSPEAGKRDFAAIVLAYAFKYASETWAPQIVRRLGAFTVRRYKRDTRLSVREIVATAPREIYIQYPHGRIAEKLSVLDGKQLYHKSDDLVDLQAAWLTQDGSLVISAVRSDKEEIEVLEADLLKAFFEAAQIRIVDLVEVNVIEGRQRSRPVPSMVRQQLGQYVKFVEIRGLPNKKAWKVGNEVWFNLANPAVQSVYQTLTKNEIHYETVRAAKAFTSILSSRFDEALEIIAESFRVDEI